MQGLLSKKAPVSQGFYILLIYSLFEYKIILFITPLGARLINPKNQTENLIFWLTLQTKAHTIEDNTQNSKR
jgi:hypothetical protein